MFATKLKKMREEMQLANYIVKTEKPTIVSAFGAIPKPDSDKISLKYPRLQPTATQ